MRKLGARFISWTTFDISSFSTLIDGQTLHGNAAAPIILGLIIVRYSKFVNQIIVATRIIMAIFAVNYDAIFDYAIS